MHGLHIEKYALHDKSVSHLLARHIAETGAQGKIAVVAKKPSALLSSTRRQWFRLIRHVQNARSSTLNAKRKQQLDGCIQWMQCLTFSSARALDDLLEADITFMDAANCVRVAPVCYMLYVTYDFSMHIFKVWFPGSQHSRISLASHYLEVSETPLADYVNEFESGFAGDFKNSNGEHSNRFILKVYVVGDYLDQHVDRERVSFRFGKKADGIYPIGRMDIEAKAAELVRERFKEQFTTERSKKLEKVENITSGKPWLKRYEHDLDLSQLRVNSSEEDFEVALEVVRIRKDRELTISAEDLAKSDARKLTDDKTEDLIREITQSNKDDLARYVARRKAVLDIFVKSMEYNNNGKHTTEKVVHDIIYPMQTDSESVAPNYSNLWLLDERLNFTEFISSDKQMGDGNTDRTDLFIFHHQVAFRAGDEKQNPITIVEFKKPGRDDFTSRTDKYNPITQIIRYTNEIREGKYKTPVGRPIHTDKDTQFYGYVVVEFTEKVKKWLSEEENFTPMPDGLGYYKWLDRISLYVEVLSWDKVLKDAQLRNRIFAEKLGLH